MFVICCQLPPVAGAGLNKSKSLVSAVAVFSLRVPIPPNTSNKFLPSHSPLLSSPQMFRVALLAPPGPSWLITVPSSLYSPAQPSLARQL